MTNVLILGATGGIGKRVLGDLLKKGDESMTFRIICRSAGNLPKEAKDNPKVEVIEKKILKMKDNEIKEAMVGITHIVSCLGHRVKQMFSPPYNLCQAAVKKLVTKFEKETDDEKLKVIIINTVGVGHPDGSDKKMRSVMQNVVLGLLWFLIPPHRDNYRLSHYVYKQIKKGDKSIEWCVVRPDSLHNKDEDVEYEVYPDLQCGLFAPKPTGRLTVARFISDLVSQDNLWSNWKNSYPVVYDAGQLGQSKS